MNNTTCILTSCYNGADMYLASNLSAFGKKGVECPNMARGSCASDSRSSQMTTTTLQLQTERFQRLPFHALIRRSNNPPVHCAIKSLVCHVGIAFGVRVRVITFTFEVREEPTTDAQP